MDALTDKSTETFGLGFFFSSSEDSSSEDSSSDELS